MNIFYALCLVFVLSVLASKEQNTFDTGKCVFQYNSNGNAAPKYFFWTNSSAKYQVQFMKLTEYDQNNKAIRGGLALTSLSWDKTNTLFDNKTDQWNFNFSTTGKTNGNDVSPFQKLVVANHIKNGTEEWKFDILIYNYTWASPNNTLGFSFQLRSPDSQNDQYNGQLKKDYVKNNDSYFYIALKATVFGLDGKQVTITPSLAFNSESDIEVKYPHFDGILEHDPSVGLGKPPGSMSTFLLVLIVAAAIVGVILVVTVVAVIFMKVRKPRYESI